MTAGTIKIYCSYCNKHFNLIPLKSCQYHFCNECIYLWMSNYLFDNNLYINQNINQNINENINEINLF